MRYTYRDLITRLEMNGCWLAEMVVGQMMRIVEEETGKFPDYGDIVPDWILNQCIGGPDE